MPNDYPINGTWKLKIAYTLQVHGKAMTQYNILKYINSMELYIGPGPAKSVSSVLSSNTDLFYRHTRERGHMLYGLKEWFSSDGRLLVEYNPEIESLS
jgi:hypothetical protein